MNLYEIIDNLDNDYQEEYEDITPQARQMLDQLEETQEDTDLDLSLEILYDYTQAEELTEEEEDHYLALVEELQAQGREIPFSIEY